MKRIREVAYQSGVSKLLRKNEHKGSKKSGQEVVLLTNVRWER